MTVYNRDGDGDGATRLSSGDDHGIMLGPFERCHHHVLRI